MAKFRETYWKKVADALGVSEERLDEVRQQAWQATVDEFRTAREQREQQEAEGWHGHHHHGGHGGHDNPFGGRPFAGPPMGRGFGPRGPFGGLRRGFGPFGRGFGPDPRGGFDPRMGRGFGPDPRGFDPRMERGFGSRGGWGRGFGRGPRGWQGYHEQYDQQGWDEPDAPQANPEPETRTKLG